MTYLPSKYSQTNIWGKITGLPTWVSNNRQHGTQIIQKYDCDTEDLWCARGNESVACVEYVYCFCMVHAKLIYRRKWIEKERS